MSTYQKGRNLHYIAAFRLRQKGFTNREIAEQTGIPESKVADRVKLGHRLHEALWVSDQ